MKYLVKATDKYVKTNTSDNLRSKEESEKQGKIVRYVPEEGECWKVDYERKETLVGLGFVEVVKEITEEVVETTTKEIKTEKAVKKTTKKAK